MINLLVAVVFALPSYFDKCEEEVNRTLEFVDDNKKEILTITKYLDNDEALAAMCIVAPEISQYSPVIDATETFALKTLYVQGKVANFSIGPFQMKPSFAEAIEQYIYKEKQAYKKYNALVINRNSDREIRYERVCRLSSIEWQILYLSAYYNIVCNREDVKNIKNAESRLKFCATLYNAGFELDKESVLELFKKKGFPHLSHDKFNYGDIACEFFQCNEFCSYLRK